MKKVIIPPKPAAPGDEAEPLDETDDALLDRIWSGIQASSDDE